jgi:DNA-binding transcriptional ArsR family regulator
VGAIQSLAHRTYQVNRLLELAALWLDDTTDDTACPTTRRLRTARQLRASEVDELVRAYQAGATVYELGKQFGVNRKTVSSHLRARGVTMRRQGLRPSDVPAAVTLYDDGWSLHRIGQKFGCDAVTVHRRLREAGVSMRKARRRC